MIVNASQALCTEAALNAVQRTYPQIYKSNDRLLIKPEHIGVTARDFVLSAKSGLFFASTFSMQALTLLDQTSSPLRRGLLQASQPLCPNICSRFCSRRSTKPRMFLGKCCRMCARSTFWKKPNTSRTRAALSTNRSCKVRGKLHTMALESQND